MNPRNTLVWLMSLLIVLGIHTHSFGFTWKQAGTWGNNSIIFALAINPLDPLIIYAGNYKSTGGVYKSIDGGKSWTRKSNSLGNNFVQALTIDRSTPLTLYAGTYGTDSTAGGVYKSTDGGETWGQASPDTAKYDIRSLAIDPFTPQTIYAGALGGGIFKSTDGAGSWKPFNAGLANPKVTALVIDPQNSRTIYAGTAVESPYTGGIYKSIDGAANWITSGLTNLDIRALAIDPTTPLTIYAGTFSGIIYKTINGGDSWNVIYSELRSKSIMSLVINPANSQIIYAGTDGGGVFRTTDGGSTWETVNTGLPVVNNNVKVMSLAMDPDTPSKIYAGTFSSGVFKESYTVIFDSNGGSIVPSQIIYSGDTVTKPDAPLKDGYTFAGWYTDQDLTIPYDFTAQVTGNFTLYAKWAIVRYNLTLNISGNGTVNNITPPPTFNCDKASCSGTFDRGTGFTFRATPAYGSTFGKWSGCSSINAEGDCVVTIANATTITAPFNLIPPVRIGNNYYLTFSEAYEAASETGITLIEAKTGPFEESLYLDKAIQFQGGFDAVYSTPPTGMTAVIGTVTIGTGSLNAKSLVIR